MTARKIVVLPMIRKCKPVRNLQRMKMVQLVKYAVRQIRIVLSIPQQLPAFFQAKQEIVVRKLRIKTEK